jgi:hypothetical protein
MTATTTPRVQSVLATGEAHAILRDAWLSGKNRDNPHARWTAPGRDEGAWVIVDMPLSWIQANEAGDLYDGTVNLDRARAYAKVAAIDAPVYLAFGPRAVRFGRSEAAVMDGGHRTSAARMRGDQSLRAIMRQQDFDHLVKTRTERDRASCPQPAAKRPAESNPALG